MKTLTVRDDTLGFNPKGGFLVCLYRGKTLATFHYGDTYFGTLQEALAKVGMLMVDKGFTHSRVIMN